MADSDSSELSDMSSVPSIPSEVENDVSKRPKGILKFLTRVLPKTDGSAQSPPLRKRSPSPVHEFVLADNPDIAFIVMFRSRFGECFPKSLPHFGPQELERDVVETVPGDAAELFLCALLGLLLNRKQDVKPGHYHRALEDAVNSHKSQWPQDWEEESPLSSGTFESITPTKRLSLLRALIHWSLASSEAIRTIVNKSYKQTRQENDLNQPLSVQPWGSDSDKRRYYLIEGQGDTAFRVYRESNFTAISNRTWQSVAGNIEELKGLADRLNDKDGGPKARDLGGKITNGLPRFEATEEKRKRREYRQIRNAQFKRPDAGFSLYEGRTRGKRVKYTYSDDESDSEAPRQSARSAAAEPTGPVTTMSGRRVKPPTRMAAEGRSTRSNPAGAGSDNPADADVATSSSAGRPRRAAAVRSGLDGRSVPGSRRGQDEWVGDDEGSEQDYGDDERDEGYEADDRVPDDSAEEDDDDKDENEEPADGGDEDEPDRKDTPKKKSSLVIKLSIGEAGKAASPSPPRRNQTSEDQADSEMLDAPSPGRPSSPPSTGDHAANPKLRGLPPKSLAFRGSPDKAKAGVTRGITT